MTVPALSSLLRSVPNLRTPLIGRETERATARSRLRDDTVPLLTLIGPGGVGKTSLALAIAQDVAAYFRDGVIWVDLAPLADPVFVPATVAAALDLTLAANQPVLEEMARHLCSRQLLLLVDNCEHLATAVADLVSGLLATCPALQVLATSRAPLRIRGEHELAVEPLAVPPRDVVWSLEAWEQVDAVRLFIERAQAIQPAFRLEEGNASAVAELCRRLDGLPLAIELAAAQTKLLPPNALLTQLGERLGVLSGGPRDLPARQRTIHDAIAWSHDLLSVDDRILFRRLGSFVSGWTLEAAEAVANSDGSLHLLRGMRALIDTSLVRLIDPSDGEPRFTMLETIREFALEQLNQQADEADAVRRAHAAFYADLACDAWSALTSGVPAAVRRIRVEQDNLRATLRHLLNSGDAETALRVAGRSLSEYWLVAGGQFTEGRTWLDLALTHGAHASPAARAWGFYGVAILAVHQFDLVEARRAAMASLALARGANDPELAVQSPFALCLVDEADGQFAAAEVLASDAVAAARTVSNPGLLGWSLMALGNVQWHTGDPIAATAALEEALALFRGFGGVWGETDALTILAGIARAAGALERAAALHVESLVLRRGAGETVGTFNDLVGIADIAHAMGHPDAAARLLGAEDAYRTFTGYGGFGETPAIRSRIRQALAEQLGDEHFTRAWVAGQALTTEQAIGEALTLAEDLRAGSPVPPQSLLQSAQFRLTPREVQVLRLVVTGRSNQEIGEALFISPRTATTHVSNILGKLEVQTRTEAAAIAVRDGLI